MPPNASKILIQNERCRYKRDSLILLINEDYVLLSQIT